MTDSTTRPLKVFLCHSSGDKPAVRELYRQLIAEGWMDVWLDEMKLLPGQEWDIEIEKAVEEADIVLVCLSTRSVDKEGYVQKELRFVLNIADEKPEGSIFVIPLRLDDCIVPRRLRHWQYVDYFPDSQKSYAYTRLLESFKVRTRKLGISFNKPKVELAPAPFDPTQDMPTPVVIPQKEQNADIGVAPRAFPDLKGIPSKLNLRFLGLVVGAVLVIIALVLAVKANFFAHKLGIGSTMVSEKDGMTLVYVPAGKFTMGNDKDSSNEQPVHTVNLDAFWIDQTEVTNAMYAKCMDAEMCGLPSGTTQYNDPDYANHPVVYVTWNQAVEYCTWAERRLPTEAEWEKAASWDAKNQTKYVYPWGNDAPNNNLLNYNNAVGDTTDVGKYSDGASPYGALDMAGNVWEWVNDWYSESYDPSLPTDNPSGPDSGQSRVLRGGAWNLINYEVRSARRSSGNPTYTDLNLGFRCAMSASP